MKNISIWKDTIESLSFPKLDSNKETDILIIGGGITGCSNYYFLSKTDYKVMLVEQNKIGMGVTSNSTGKLTFLQNDLLNKILDSEGEEVASKYLKSQIEAINLVTEIIKKERINCDLVKVKSSVYTNNRNEINKLKELEEFLLKNNIKVIHTNNTLVKEKDEISVDDTYLFHPIKFVYGLIKDKKNIYENTSIKKIKEKDGYYYCYTNNYVIKCKYVIIASHYPYFTLPFLFPIKAYLEKSYLSASISKHNNISLISYSNPFISIRTYKDYLIYLSNSHLINNDLDDKKSFSELQKKLKDIKLIPEYLWSNSDVMTNDNMPYIGEIKDRMIIATGYNTWGLASSVLSGSIIRDIILKKENDYINLFDPKRINVDQIIGNITNIYKNMSGFIKSYSKKQDKVIEKNSIYLYKENKVLTKCPHLKCKLLLNEIEETWDCPCHGSRFDKNGKCISGPSNRDIDLK